MMVGALSLRYTMHEGTQILMWILLGEIWRAPQWLRPLWKHTWYEESKESRVLQESGEILGENCQHQLPGHSHVSTGSFFVWTLHSLPGTWCHSLYPPSFCILVCSQEQMMNNEREWEVLSCTYRFPFSSLRSSVSAVLNPLFASWQFGQLFQWHLE